MPNFELRFVSFKSDAYWQLCDLPVPRPSRDCVSKEYRRAAFASIKNPDRMQLKLRLVPIVSFVRDYASCSDSQAGMQEQTSRLMCTSA